MRNDVQFGSSVPVGPKAIDDFLKLKLGSCVLTWMPLNVDGALTVARKCREHDITLYFSEWLARGTTDRVRAASNLRSMPVDQFLTREQLEAVIAEAGDCYAGRMSAGEVVGLVYWPREYVNRTNPAWRELPHVDTMAEARDVFVGAVRDFLERDRELFGCGPLVSVDPSLLAKYLVQAGVDMIGLESMPGDPRRMQAAARGAARAYGKRWGVHIAMGWYGGIRTDELWLKRWKVSLDDAYISGANFIWPESGIYDLKRHEKHPNTFNSRPMKRARLALREAHQFASIHTRPTGGPRSPVGILHGHLDGAGGLWNQTTWGQYGDDKWLHGSAEAGWDLYDELFRRQPYANPHVQGDADWSGNPPAGQCDIVPIEAGLDGLKQYRCLVCLGWNTMTGELYDKLKAYVAAGGRLVMYLPQLSTHVDRADDFKLYKRGDLTDLFGVKVRGRGKRGMMGLKFVGPSALRDYPYPDWGRIVDPLFMGEMQPAKLELRGATTLFAVGGMIFEGDKGAKQPVVTEYKLGKGVATLVGLYQYPADPGAIRFTRDLLRTIVAGEQGDIRLLGSDRVRYAVYDATRPKHNVIYLLNTDPDLPADVMLEIKGKRTGPIHLPPTEMRVALIKGGTVLVPEDRRVDLKGWTRGEVTLTSYRAQRIDVFGSTTLTINGKKCTSKGQVRIARRVDSDRRAFFARDFLDEPTLRVRDTKLPY